MARVKSTVRAWGSPSRYFQGPDLIKQLPEFTGIYGKKAYAIIDQFFYNDLSKQLKKDFSEVGAEIETAIFNSEVTAERVAKAAELAKEFNPDVCVAIGGGKTMDTTKAVANELGVPVIILPTTASTDAPTIALSVMYTEEGVHVGARHYIKNPDIVLMDSTIIANAPARFMASGIGDALSTYFEAKANMESDSSNYVSGGYRGTLAGKAIAEACYKELLKNGVKAMQSVEKNVVSEALENVIEINTLLSGLGVENNGCSGAHSICEGISALVEEDKKTLHGEKVAFGTLCQLVAENVDDETIEMIYKFCIECRLPVCLADLHIKNTEENMRAIAEKSMESYWETEPFFVDENVAYSAIALADKLGEKYARIYRTEQPYSLGGK